MGLPELLILIVGLVGGSLWVWMIIDCATHEPSGMDKIVWILVILLGKLYRSAYLSPGKTTKSHSSISAMTSEGRY